MTCVAEVCTHVLGPAFTQPFAWSFGSAAVCSACRVETVREDGAAGWGGCRGPAELRAAVAADLCEHLSVTALSGIEVALWDLKVLAPQ